jgi:hypothetical protein
MLDSRRYPDASTVRSFRFPAGPWSMAHARLGSSGLVRQQRTALFPLRGALAVPTSPRIAAAPKFAAGQVKATLDSDCFGRVISTALSESELEARRQCTAHAFIVLTNSDSFLNGFTAQGYDLT